MLSLLERGLKVRFASVLLSWGYVLQFLNKILSKRGYSLSVWND
jgi:hypothetical protein